MNRHPGEGALLRFIDGNAGDRERARLSAHLGRCAECGHRARELREMRLLLIEGLVAAPGAAEPDPPALHLGTGDRNGPDGGRPADQPPRAGPGLAARGAIAAGLLLALGLAATAAPVRSWIADRLGALAGPSAEEAGAPQGGAAPPEDARARLPDPAAGTTRADFDGVRRGPPTFSLAFIPQSERFVVEVEHRQAGGSLHVAFGGGDAAVDTWGPTPLRWLRVSPGQLRLRNDSSSEADYRLHLPFSVREVIVRVAGTEVGRILVRRGEPPPELAFDLSLEPE